MVISRACNRERIRVAHRLRSRAVFVLCCTDIVLKYNRVKNSLKYVFYVYLYLSRGSVNCKLPTFKYCKGNFKHLPLQP